MLSYEPNTASVSREAQIERLILPLYRVFAERCNHLTITVASHGGDVPIYCRGKGVSRRGCFVVHFKYVHAFLKVNELFDRLRCHYDQGSWRRRSAKTLYVTK